MDQSFMKERKILPLVLSMSLPMVISMAVNALYNIVDQIFIGQGVGMYGNAATNVAFPLTTLATAVGLMLGIGGASNFNLEMGRKHEENAKKIAGTAFGSLVIAGVIICIVARIFLRPLITVFGATEYVMDYAMTYVGITSLGMLHLGDDMEEIPAENYIEEMRKKRAERKGGRSGRRDDRRGDDDRREGKGRRRRQTDEDVLDMMREHRPGKRKSDKAFDKKSDKKSDKKFEKKGSDRKRSDKSEKKSKGLFGKERTFKKNDIDKKTGKAKKWK